MRRTPGLGAGVGEGAGGAEGGEDRDGDVDEQAPAPVQVFGEQAAEDQADGRAAAGDGAVDAERLGAFLGSVNVVDSRESAAGARSAPKAPCRARAANSMAGPGGAAQRGGHGEAEQADDEGAFAAEEVADAAAEQEQAAEGQGVGGDDPLAVGDGDAQVALGGGQRDVHDRGVQDDHQLGDGDDGESPPAARVVVGGPPGARGRRMP